MKRFSFGLNFLILFFSVNFYGQQDFNDLFIESEINKLNQILSRPVIIDSLINLAHLNSNSVKSQEEEMKVFDEKIIQNKNVFINSFDIRSGVGFFRESRPIVNGYVESLIPRVSFSLLFSPKNFFLIKSKKRELENLKKETFYVKEQIKDDLKSKLVNLLYEQLFFLEDLKLQSNLLNDNDQYLNLTKFRFKSGSVTLVNLQDAETRNNKIKRDFIRIKYGYLKVKSEYDLLIGKI